MLENVREKNLRELLGILKKIDQKYKIFNDLGMSVFGTVLNDVLPKISL